MHIAIVAGEASGDLLGASLIAELKKKFPEATFSGIGGPKMQALGFSSLMPFESLNVMGLIEVIEHLPRLLRIKKQLIQHFTETPPDLFIGIDYPDFNLRLEHKLKSAGIRTVHYVSPSVWAWRKRRVKLIKKATDLVLCLLPFEVNFYTEHQVPAKFVGHPLADEIPLSLDKQQARETFNLAEDERVITLLPGSRAHEIELLGPVFLEAARRCRNIFPHLKFLSPQANETRLQEFNAIKALNTPDLPVETFIGQVNEAVTASDAVLVASGTATFEVLLLKRPMVVAAKVNRITYWIAKLLVKTPYIALPNLIAGQELVPEFIQEQASVEQLSTALIHLLQHQEDSVDLISKFASIHEQFKINASYNSACAIENLIKSTA